LVISIGDFDWLRRAFLVLFPSYGAKGAWVLPRVAAAGKSRLARICAFAVVIVVEGHVEADERPGAAPSKSTRYAS
jgi:hypothetical protein